MLLWNASRQAIPHWINRENGSPNLDHDSENTLNANSASTANPASPANSANR